MLKLYMPKKHNYKSILPILRRIVKSWLLDTTKQKWLSIGWKILLRWSKNNLMSYLTLGGLIIFTCCCLNLSNILKTSNIPIKDWVNIIRTWLKGMTSCNGWLRGQKLRSMGIWYTCKSKTKYKRKTKDSIFKCGRLNSFLMDAKTSRLTHIISCSNLFTKHFCNKNCKITAFIICKQITIVKRIKRPCYCIIHHYCHQETNVIKTRIVYHRNQDRRSCFQPEKNKLAIEIVITTTLIRSTSNYRRVWIKWERRTRDCRMRCKLKVVK